MRRHTTIFRADLILLTLGLATLMYWPEALPGKLLASSDLAKIHGLNPETKADTIYPVSCEAFNVGPNQTTPEGCAALIIVPPNLVCEVCSDGIATFANPNPNGPGAPQFDDGNYQCDGQKSTAPCTAVNGHGPCGTYAPQQGVFCTGNPTDWDAE